MTYADASFVVALFVENDEHWPAAWRWWKNQRGPSLIVSRLTIFEAENTIRGMVVARKLTKAQAHSAIQGISRARLWLDHWTASYGLREAAHELKQRPEGRTFKSRSELRATLAGLPGLK